MVVQDIRSLFENTDTNTVRHYMKNIPVWVLDGDINTAFFLSRQYAGVARVWLLPGAMPCSPTHLHRCTVLDNIQRRCAGSIQHSLERVYPRQVRHWHWVWVAGIPICMAGYCTMHICEVLVLLGTLQHLQQAHNRRLHREHAHGNPPHARASGLLNPWPSVQVMS